VELATVGPGFDVDEEVATLGQTLQLPAFLEPHREQIQQGLKPLIIPEWVNPLETEEA
jgi:glyoxalase family protein